MRRRLGKFLPIVLIAVLVQIFAPIGATWAASIAASDPLHAAVICHGNAASVPNRPINPASPAPTTAVRFATWFTPADRSARHRPTVAAPWRHAARVAWLDAAPDLFSSRAGSHAQARAPPSFS